MSLPTEDELKRLSQKACVAYAVRASLRVRPLYRSDDPAHGRSLDEANQAAMDFAGTTGSDSAFAYAGALEAATGASATVARAAMYAAHAAAHPADAAQDAARAADAASRAADAEVSDVDPPNVYASIIAECRRDYETLFNLSGHAPGALGDPIDVKGDRGPLGSLWSKGEPEWFRQRKSPIQMSFDFGVEPLEFLLEPGSATSEEIADLFYEISKLYRMMGGSGINFSVIDAYAFDEAEVTA